jgi:hypothetical protein
MKQTEENMNTEYTVHFQKGTRVGARSLHMVHVEAGDVDTAIRRARGELASACADWSKYRLTRVDHFEDLPPRHRPMNPTRWRLPCRTSR